MKHKEKKEWDKKGKFPRTSNYPLALGVKNVRQKLRLACLGKYILFAKDIDLGKCFDVRAEFDSSTSFTMYIVRCERGNLRFIPEYLYSYDPDLNDFFKFLDKDICYEEILSKKLYYELTDDYTPMDVFLKKNFWGDVPLKEAAKMRGITYNLKEV